MGPSRFLSVRAVELLVVALVGAGLALGGAALLGKLGDHTTTTIQQVTPSPVPAAAATQTSSKALTPEAIYRQDGTGVVQITATSVTQSAPNPFFPATPQTSKSLGSGFVLDRAGHIITNFHVIQGAQKVQVSFSGQDQLPATVVGKDRSTDLAVLKIDAHARALTPLPLGDSDAARVGDPVYAIGNPFGLTRTLTTGVVSAVQRQIFAPNGVPIDSAIQTDAAINHGNSGGPLIDAAGRVLGVTSQIQTGSDQNQGNVGIGFAIPVNTVRDIAGQIIASGKAEHAFLGLSSAAVTPQLKKLFNLPTASGLLVREVTKGSGAAKAGIKGGSTSVVVEGESYMIGGDIITAVDGKPMTSADELFAVVQQKHPGDTLKIELYHDNSKRTVTAKLGTRAGP
ncbi:MAG TPA: trypsin-like peptidase domain-containing protein [Gaiellaceae bacterium]